MSHRWGIKQHPRSRARRSQRLTVLVGNWLSYSQLGGDQFGTAWGWPVRFEGCLALPTAAYRSNLAEGWHWSLREIPGRMAGMATDAMMPEDFHVLKCNWTSKDACIATWVFWCFSGNACLDFDERSLVKVQVSVPAPTTSQGWRLQERHRCSVLDHVLSARPLWRTCQAGLCQRRFLPNLWLWWGQGHACVQGGPWSSQKRSLTRRVMMFFVHALQLFALFVPDTRSSFKQLVCGNPLVFAKIVWHRFDTIRDYGLSGSEHWILGNLTSTSLAWFKNTCEIYIIKCIDIFQMFERCQTLSMLRKTDPQWWYQWSTSTQLAGSTESLGMRATPWTLLADGEALWRDVEVGGGANANLSDEVFLDGKGTRFMIYQDAYECLW